MRYDRVRSDGVENDRVRNDRVRNDRLPQKTPVNFTAKLSAAAVKLRISFVNSFSL